MANLYFLRAHVFSGNWHASSRSDRDYSVGHLVEKAMQITTRRLGCPHETATGKLLHTACVFRTRRGQKSKASQDTTAIRRCTKRGMEGRTTDDRRECIEEQGLKRNEEITAE